MKDLKALCAIGGIVVLESIALMKGIDGTILTMVVATLAGLGGYYIRGNKNDILSREEEYHR
ncbi:MAG: hypothetical protein DRI61_13185 [Chloroflexi bacterium]|nr:MAG: hypothetical protein DRI61_13185 [Chloroflexota bacterium]